MNIEQAKEIVQSLSSLYPLKDYEEEALQLILYNINYDDEFHTEYQIKKHKRHIYMNYR